MKTCKVDNCDRQLYVRGLCTLHYQRFMRHGDPTFTLQEMHGLSHTREYHVWDAIKDRCLNPNHAVYYRYGGRGITVCDRWKNSFIAFYEDMGAKPSLKAEIDRIDNDGNYEPGNCEWTTRTTNGRHTAATILNLKKARQIRISYASGNYTQKQLALEYGIFQSVVSRIINNKAWKGIA